MHAHRDISVYMHTVMRRRLSSRLVASYLTAGSRGKTGDKKACWQKDKKSFTRTRREGISLLPTLVPSLPRLYEWTENDDERACIHASVRALAVFHGCTLPANFQFVFCGRKD